MGSFLKAVVPKCVVFTFFGHYLDSSVQVFYLKNDIVWRFQCKEINCVAIWQNISVRFNTIVFKIFTFCTIKYCHCVPFDKKLACIINYWVKQSFPWPLVSYCWGIFISERYRPTFGSSHPQCTHTFWNIGDISLKLPIWNQATFSWCFNRLTLYSTLWIPLSECWCSASTKPERERDITEIRTKRALKSQFAIC